MFYGCSGLTSAPELPATILESSCYCNMFYGCSNLNKITMLAIDYKDENCLIDWLYRVSSTGIIIKAAEMDEAIFYQSIPSGWTVVNYTGNN